MMKAIIYSFLVIFSIVACQHDPIKKVGLVEPITCDPDTVYFENDIFPIIQSNCTFSDCHGNGSAQDGVDLTSYASIISTADVRPFNLDGSDLYEVITDTDLDKRMPYMPNDPLSDAQIAMIAKWINQGALNNRCDRDCDTNITTFSGAISPIIQANCQGCHSGGEPFGDLYLTNYNEIKTIAESGLLSKVIKHEADVTPMPFERPKLMDCQIRQIEKWIEEGMLDN